MLQATARTYRNAYAGLSRSTWMLSLIMLINRSGTMVVPFMTLYLTSPKMGYSIGQAGFVFGLFGFGAFSGAWLGGKMTDRFGFYPVQLFTLCGGGILFFVLGQMQQFPLICLFTFLLSFVNEAFRPANSTAIAFYSKEENRTRSYALNRLAINLGWAAGSAAGGIIAHFNYELLFWVDGCTNLFAALIMWLTLKPVNYKPIQTSSQINKKSRSAYQDKIYLFFILTMALFACAFFQLFTNLPVFFRLEMKLTEPVIGGLMAMNGLIIAVGEMVLVYKLEGRRPHTFYIPIGVGLVSLAFFTLTIPAAAMLVAPAMIILVTLGESTSMPFMNSFWISRTDSFNRGQYAALYSMAWSVAQSLGPIGGAQIAQHFGFRALWITNGLLTLLAAFAFRHLHKIRNK